MSSGVSVRRPRPAAPRHDRLGAPWGNLGGEADVVVGAALDGSRYLRKDSHSHDMPS